MAVILGDVPETGFSDVTILFGLFTPLVGYKNYGSLVCLFGCHVSHLISFGNGIMALLMAGAMYNGQFIWQVYSF